MRRLISSVGKKILLALPASIFFEEIVYYSKLGKWIKDNASTITPKFNDRFQMYDFLISKYRPDELTYLEFGVYKGETIDYFRKKNSNPISFFAGFDTFTGLPENWRISAFSTMKAGDFNTDGIIPSISDKRVLFYQGLFSETLPNFQQEKLKSVNNKNIIIHIDSDLYSSSLYILTQLHEYLSEGAIVIFDDFPAVLHEFKSLLDFTSAYSKKYEILCYTKEFNQIALIFK